MKKFIFDLQRFAVIENGDDSKYVFGTDDDDTIRNYGDYVYIYAGDGDDMIQNSHCPGFDWGGNVVEINAGDGDDTIQNSVSDVEINAGAGNDTITVNGNRTIINGGAGDDYFKLYFRAHRTVVQYTEGDGNDKIRGFNEDDTLKIAGSSYSAKKSGKNIIVTVGKGKVTLVGAAALSAVNIDANLTNLSKRTRPLRR